MDLLDWLNNHQLITEYNVLDHYDLDDATLLKLRIVLADGSILFTKEYIDATSRKYAFHWQKDDATWLVRWDNAPHFPKLLSFPHHRHDYRTGSENVTDSVDITLTDVLNYIHIQLTTPSR